MQLYIDGDRDACFAWLDDEPTSLPCPPGLEWMTAEQLQGYYLLHQPSDEPGGRNST